MKNIWLLLLLIPLVMGGCGTTGKKYNVKIFVENNTNTTVNIDPSISAASGDTDTTSENTTDTPLDVGLGSAVDALESGLIDKAGSTLVETLSPEAKP